MGRQRQKQGPKPDHESVVADWQQHAQENDERNFEFLRSLKWHDYGFDTDELAAELHERAFQIIDCTRCANCCKTMTVKLEQSDVDRIARHLDMTSAKFVEKFLEPDEEEGGFIMRQKPCPLLGDDNRCTVYDVRPTVCREYPHTDKDCFSTRTINHANNALDCPAVYWIVEHMRDRARR